MSGGFHFITAAWGRHVRYFLDVSLPTQLTNGNLLAFRGERGTRYRFITTPQHVDELRAAPLLRSLSTIMPVDVVPVPDVQDRAENSKYDVMTAFHHRGILDAHEAGANTIFLGPDLIFSDGSLGRLRRLASEGKRAVLGTALRAVRECLLPNYLGEYGRGVPTAFTGREVVRMAMEHLHGLHHYLLWDAPELVPWPSVVVWRVGKRGLLLRAYHLHPWLVAPEHRVEPTATIDDVYLAAAVPNPNDWEFLTDSDEFACLKMSRAAHAEAAPLEAVPEGEREQWVADWAAKYAGEHHRRYAHVPIRFHQDDLDGSWAKTERDTEKIISRIETLIPGPQTAAI